MNSQNISNVLTYELNAKLTSILMSSIEKVLKSSFHLIIICLLMKLQEKYVVCHLEK